MNNNDLDKLVQGGMRVYLAAIAVLTCTLGACFLAIILLITNL